MTDETLLPCPFCGSNECEAFAQDEDDRPYQSAIVRCFNCDAQSAQMVGKDKIIRAIAAWNKRPATQLGNSGQPVTVPAGYALVPAEPTITIMDEIDAIFDFGAEDSKDAWHRLLAAAPKAPDNWIPVSERMPPCETGVLVATEMDGHGDWRMKWATYVPEHPDAINGWFIPGASWTPTHWQPLPEPPKVKP